MPLRGSLACGLNSVATRLRPPHVPAERLEVSLLMVGSGPEAPGRLTYRSSGEKAECGFRDNTPLARKVGAVATWPWPESLERELRDDGRDRRDGGEGRCRGGEHEREERCGTVGSELSVGCAQGVGAGLPTSVPPLGRRTRSAFRGALAGCGGVGREGRGCHRFLGRAVMGTGCCPGSGASHSLPDSFPEPPPSAVLFLFGFLGTGFFGFLGGFLAGECCE